MWKKGIALLAAAALAMTLGGCGGKAGNVETGVRDTQADKGLPVVGDHIKFDPNKLINNGEPITVNYWYLTDTTDHINQKLVDAYEAIHPNVTINFVENPWDSIWTKLPLALQRGENGPTMFFVHNSYEDLLLPYMEPYDIPLDDILADYTTAASHVIDGKVYYLDYGMMTGAVYYNKKLWAEAGLTDADIPKTWDELARVAQKLTKRDANGNLTQAGFNFNNNGSFMLLDLYYQRGQNIFDASGKKATLNNEAGRANLQMLKDLYDKYKVGDVHFGTDCVQSFGQGQSAMTYRWGNCVNDMKNNYPDIEYGTFEVPTVDGKTPYAYDRYNGESTMGINKNANAAQKEVAQDFLKFYLTNEDYLRAMCEQNSVFPCYAPLQNDPELMASPAVSAVKEHIDRYVWPGPMPATLENNMKIAVEDVLYNDKDISDTLQTAEDTINIDLASTNFVSAENKYKYYKAP